MTESFTEHATAMLEGAIQAAAAATKRAYELNTRAAGQREQDAERRVRYWRGCVERGAYPAKRATGRCRTKGCRYATSQLCETIARHFHLDPVQQYPAGASCPEHGGLLEWRFIAGSLKESVPCDARCTTARGHKCECSCAGANHGADL